MSIVPNGKRLPQTVDLGRLSSLLSKPTFMYPGVRVVLHLLGTKFFMITPLHPRRLGWKADTAQDLQLFQLGLPQVLQSKLPTGLLEVCFYP